VSTLIARRTQLHQDTLSSYANNSHAAFTSAVNGLASFYVTKSGSSQVDAAHQELANFYIALQTQATTLAYLDTIWLLAIVTACMVPLVFLMKKNDPGKQPAGAH
jgi:DHA2 family multidrug resistance protein